MDELRSEVSEPSVDEIRKEVVAEQRKRIMRKISENLANPGMKQILQKQQRVLMEDKYRELAEVFQLNGEESDYFMNLLTARQMLQVDMGMKLMAGVLSDEERAALMQETDKGINEINQAVESFLNNADDGAYFKYYEQTEAERAAVGSLRAELSQRGVPLEAGTEEWIVAVMHEELNQYPFSVRFEEDNQSDFSRFTDENIGRYVEEMGALGIPVRERVSQVLSADQLVVFESAYDGYVVAHEQRLLMIQQFFNPAQ